MAKILNLAVLVGLLFIFGASAYSKNEPASTLPIRINSGGAAYTDSLGQGWQADSDFTGGTTYSVTSAIANTNDPTLYQSERRGSFTYDFAVPSGTYAVTLKFAETSFTSAGQRVFDVAIDGKTVLSNFDIYAAAGGANIALDKTFAVTSAGRIRIKFSDGSAGKPVVDAIQIVSQATGASTGTTGTAPTVTAPTITTQPSSQTVSAGQTATFNVAATGTSPLSYQWMLNGTPVTGATSSSYTTPAETTSNSNSKFSVTVSNSAGNATSNAAILTVNAPVVAPTITSQPSSQVITAGQTATFNVAATGTSPMSYQWMKNGSAIGGATSASYTTPAETTSNSNTQFAVTVSNSAGSATSNGAILTVNAAPTSPVTPPATVAPTITAQPVSTSVIAGQTATFSVAASGTSPMTYQWMMNGTAISGATSSSYTTPAETTSNNNAQFSVAVSNSAGSATSTAATLTVTAATALLNASSSSLSFGSVNVSTSSSLNITLANAGNSSVTISNVTISGAGFNVSGVSTGQILSPGQSTTLTATFSPSGAGSVTGSVAVASNASNSPDSITLSGTGVAAASYSVAVSWSASTSADITGYNTYSSTTSGGPYTKLTSTPVAAMTYTDSTVHAGLTYYYVVTAVDSANVESAYSSQISATIP